MSNRRAGRARAVTPEGSDPAPDVGYVPNGGYITPPPGDVPDIPPIGPQHAAAIQPTARIHESPSTGLVYTMMGSNRAPSPPPVPRIVPPTRRIISAQEMHLLETEVYFMCCKGEQEQERAAHLVGQKRKWKDMHKADRCMFCYDDARIGYRPDGCFCVAVCRECAEDPLTLEKSRNADVQFAGLAWNLWNLHKGKFVCGNMHCGCAEWPEPKFDSRARCPRCRARYEGFICEQRFTLRQKKAKVCGGCE